MIPSLLAQLPHPESAQSIGWLALALAALIAGINQVLRLTDRLKEKPPVHQTYATKVEHGQLQDRLDLELGRERGSRKKMHEEISALQAQVAAVRTDNQNQSRDLAELKGQIKETDKRIDAVPMRTIQLLRETQQLHNASA